MMFLIYDLYFFLYSKLYFLLSFFMIIDDNSIEESSQSSQSSNEDIIINQVHIVIINKALDLDYLENNYILSDYKENLIEV